VFTVCENCCCCVLVLVNGEFLVHFRPSTIALHATGLVLVYKCNMTSLTERELSRRSSVSYYIHY